MLRCVNVVSGNTLQASDRTWLVLEGVDAPPVCTDEGVAARDLLIDLALNAPIHCRITGTLPHGARTAVVWTDDPAMTLNELMREST